MGSMQKKSDIKQGLGAQTEGDTAINRHPKYQAMRTNGKFSEKHPLDC